MRECKLSWMITVKYSNKINSKQQQYYLSILSWLVLKEQFYPLWELILSTATDGDRNWLLYQVLDSRRWVSLLQNVNFKYCCELPLLNEWKQ